MYPSPTVLHQFKMNTPHVLLAETEPQQLRFWPCSPVFACHSFCTSHLPKRDVPLPSHASKIWFECPCVSLAETKPQQPNFGCWLHSHSMQPTSYLPPCARTPQKDVKREERRKKGLQGRQVQKKSMWSRAPPSKPTPPTPLIQDYPQDAPLAPCPCQHMKAPAMSFLSLS